MRKRLTFANVTSMLALFFALSGASYAAVVLPAGSVGSRQIRQSAVTASKLAPRAVQSRNIAPGSVTGADIRLNTLGEVPTAATAAVADSAPVARVKTATVTANAAAATVTSATATCDPGLTVVGGGASLSNEDNAILNDSYPSAANRWTVDVFGSDAGGGPFTVYAICVPVAAAS
jgi:hypothetical protein